MSVSEEKKQKYLDILSDILDNADAADEGFQKVNKGASTLCDVNQVVNYNPNMTVVRNNGGRVLGYDYKYTGPVSPNTDALDINSNNDTGAYGEVDAITGAAPTISRYTGGIDTTDDKVKNTGLVSGFIDATWAAVSTLSKLGKNVAGIAADAIQATGAAFGDAFDDLLTHSTEAGADAIRALFGVDSNGNTTMYLDEDTLGALAIQLRDDGYFSSGESKYMPDDSVIEQFGTNYDKLYYSNASVEYGTYTIGGQEYTGYLYTSISVDSASFAGPLPSRHGFLYAEPLIEGSYVQIPIGPIYYQTLLVIDETKYPKNTKPTSLGCGWFRYSDNYGTHVTVGDRVRYFATYNGKRVWYGNDMGINSGTNFSISNSYTGLDLGKISWILLFGSSYSGGESVPGITDQADATNMVDAVTGADPHVVGQNLYDQYPQVMGEPLLVNVMDDSCNQVTNRYFSIPISYSPTNLNVDAPITGTLQVDPSFNPNISLDPSINIDNLIDQIVLQLQGSGAGRNVVQVIDDPDDPSEPGGDDNGGVQTLPTEIPNTGSGVTPETELPQTDVHGMWHVYNPSSAEVSALGSWLWTNSIIEQIARMFNDPTNSIIGLHAIYGEPHVSSSAAIVVGNLTSTVSARVVSSQYTQVDCGEVLLTEYFGNVFDYAPYTDVSLFLPFIGIVSLDVADVMRARLQVVYNVDVYTGACVAQISVTRDGVGGVVYQYAGSCAISYPVSAVSYNNIFSSMVSEAMGVAALASGVGGLAGLGIMAGAANAAVNSRIAHVNRSGAFSGNAGALGSKKPYLIIRRPQTNMAINFERYDGRGSNFTSQLSQCTGYTKCKEVHLNIPGAYKAELDEIDQLLHEGVIL